MNEELIASIGKLHSLSDSELKKYDSSKFVLQFSNSTMQVEEKSLRELSTYINEINECINLMNNRLSNEYILVAYYEGHIIGCKRKIKETK